MSATVSLAPLYRPPGWIVNKVPISSNGVRSVFFSNQIVGVKGSAAPAITNKWERKETRGTPHLVRQGLAHQPIQLLNQEACALGSRSLLLTRPTHVTSKDSRGKRHQSQTGQECRN